MKKILNALVSMIYVVYPITSKVWPTIVGAMRLVLEFVVWYRLYVKNEKIVARPFYINDDGVIVVYGKPRHLTATEICQEWQIDNGPLKSLAAMPGENCTCIGIDEIEGLIVAMESSYTGDDVILWHELGHVANQDIVAQPGRQFDRELGADFVAAGQIGREAAVRTLTRIKDEISHYPWWLRVAGDGALEDAVCELESRILNLRQIDQKILNIFAAEAKYRVRFIDDEIDNQEVA